MLVKKMTKMKKDNIQKNIFSENIHKSLVFDEKKAIEVAKKILDFYLNEKNIFNGSCLLGHEFDCISFDILYCDNEKTYQINKEYRQKDYPADIITFAIFADSEEKFVFDNEINLGEIIISLDKVEEKRIASRGRNDSQECEALQSRLSRATKQGTTFEEELYFLISHGIMHLLGFDHQTNEDYTFIIEAQTSALRVVRGEE